MLKLASTFIALTILVLPFQSSAQTAPPYAQQVVEASNQTYKPMQALGEPDNTYADFFGTEAWLLLDMGRLTTSDLKLHFIILEYGAKYRVEFKDEEMNNTHTGGGFFPLQTNQSTIEYTKSEPYRYIQIRNTSSETFKIDAAELTQPDATVTAPDEEVENEVEEGTEEEPSEPEVPQLPQAGDLIKLHDDGDFATQADSAVYIVGNDGNRHAYPNEITYQSWYEEFDKVTEVDTETLSSFPLGENVTIRPGTHLVKTQTSNKVYAIEPGGILRWIANETLATELYGIDWKTRVVEIPDVFFFNYTIGDHITSNVYPDGAIVNSPTGETLYIKNGTAYRVSGMQMEDLGLSSQFTVPVTAEQMSLYIDGGDLDFQNQIMYPLFD